MLFEFVKDLPVALGIVGRLDFHMFETAGTEHGTHVIADPCQVAAHLVLGGDKPVDFQVVVVSRGFEEGDEPFGGVPVKRPSSQPGKAHGRLTNEILGLRLRASAISQNS